MRAVLTLFVLVCGGVTLALDWFVVAAVVRAVRSGGWASADGVVTRCEVRHGRRGMVSLDLAYTFTVGGREYTGHDYEPDPSELMPGRMSRLLATLPAGTPVTVYFDPDNPADAVLDPGAKPVELAGLLLIFPFNLIVVGLLIAWWRVVIRPRRFDPVRHVRHMSGGLAVRLNGLSRLECFGIALLGLSVAGLLGVVFVLHSYAAVPPSWWLDGGVWVVVLSLGGLAAWKIGRPRELTERLNTLTLPTTSTGGQTVEVPRAAVVWVGVQTDRRQGKHGQYEVFVLVAVTVTGKMRREVRFAEYADRRDADALAAWLRERLGLGIGG